MTDNTLHGGGTQNHVIEIRTIVTAFSLLHIVLVTVPGVKYCKESTLREFSWNATAQCRASLTKKQNSAANSDVSPIIVLNR